MPTPESPPPDREPFEIEVNANAASGACACIVTVEGLGCNLLGCYGNSICPTPEWDRFASKSVVADQFWMDSTDTLEVLRSMWSGVHRASQEDVARADGVVNEPPIAGNRNAQRITSPGLFVTDDPRVAKLAEGCLEGEVVLIRATGIRGSADRQIVEGTRFLHLLGQAMANWAESIDELPWLWIHSRGLCGDWDAPYEYRKTMCDEGDPDPPRDVEPPRLQLDADTDPDIIFGWACGAGGQAMAMDEAWSWLERCIEGMGVATNCLRVLAGVQGFPLGEHGHIGMEYLVLEPEFGHDTEGETREMQGRSSRGPEPTASESVVLVGYTGAYSERLHCPLILRPGERLELGLRCAQFLQPHHIATLVEDWIEGDGDRLMDGDATKPLDKEREAVDPKEEGWTWRMMVESCGISRSGWLPHQRSAFVVGEQDVALIVPSWSVRWSRQGADERRGVTQDQQRVSDAAMRADAVEVLSSRREAFEPWLTQEEAVGAFSRVELFVMPDDRWQQNEVSNRAPEIVDALIPLRNAWLAHGGDGSNRLWELLWELDESLLNPVR